MGKTTIVGGLIGVLREKGLRVQPYKVGPDYIDPGYHTAAAGRPCHNLDSWLMPPERLVSMFVRTFVDADVAVIEGVMGLYDGGRDGIASTATIAKLLDTPVILVVNARSAGESVAAVVLGFLRYDPSVRIVGVVVNQLGSTSHAQMVREAVERLGVPILGMLRRDESLQVPERHLGLLPVTENDTGEVTRKFGTMAAASLDIKQIELLARQAPMLNEPSPERAQSKFPVRIGIAQDEAFSFYYPESLSMLSELGAELVPFSPLRDETLPDVDGIILGGGFPEMFLPQLSANRSMQESFREAVESGIPLYAECGGYMYLSTEVVDFDGVSYPLAGVIPAVCHMEKQLQTVGYVEARALSDNLLCRTGETLRGHEFHFSRMETTAPAAFRMRKTRNDSETEAGFAAGNLLASYLHIHFAGNVAAARRLMEACTTYRKLKLSGGRR